MFFSINKKIDYSFPNRVKWGEYFVHYDNGWHTHENYIFKGFLKNKFLNITSIDEIKKITDDEGNFCVIFYENDQIFLTTGNKQKFPIFYHAQEEIISNLYISDKKLIAPVTIGKSITGVVNENLEFEDLNISDTDVIDKIDSLLESSIIDFNYEEPVKIYLTGADTLLIAAYILKNKIPYELVSGEHLEMDYFLCHHRSTIRENFWSYSTVQHWKNKTMLLTGGHGDETLLRDPIQAQAYLKFYNEDLISICKNHEHYHSYHFLKNKNLIAYEKYKDLNFKNENDMKSWLLNLFRRDYQHWHIGNTFLYSPFDNIDLLKLSLNLSYETARKQLLDAWLSKELIRRNRPGLLKLLSPLKNYNYYKNFDTIYEGTQSLENL